MIQRRQCSRKQAIPERRFAVNISPSDGLPAINCDSWRRMPVLDFSKYEWISFDCYGTLVDWETGISDAVTGIFARHGVRRTRNEILAMFSGAEPRVQSSGEFLEYRRVLRDVMEIMAWEASVRLPQAEAVYLPDSLPGWPVFPDATQALQDMQSRYKLAIISNVDDDLFAETAANMVISFDAVISSEQAGSYKPNPRNFHLARERMGVENSNWLHVAESLYHDIGPANLLGIDSVWVNRPDRGGGSRRTDAVPSLEVPDIAALARMMFPEC